VIAIQVIQQAKREKCKVSYLLRVSIAPFNTPFYLNVILANNNMII